MGRCAEPSISESWTAGAILSRLAESLRSVDLDRADLFATLIEEVSHSLIVDLASAVALHAGGVGWRGRSILLAGPSGAGKSSLVAWLVASGFDYLSDELVILTGGCGTVAFPRPLLLKAGSVAAIAASPIRERMRSIGSPTRPMLIPIEGAGDQALRESSLVIFPQYMEGVDVSVTVLSAAQGGLRLMECNLNARNLPDHGFATVTQFARAVPAVALRYSSYDQLGGVVDLLARTIIENGFDAAMTRRLLGAIARPADETSADRKSGSQPRRSFPILEPTARKFDRRLTIGMATFDDYDGVYFTLQALRLYHSEVLDQVELLVVDNHPDGPCAEPLKRLENSIPNYRYLPLASSTGTASRELVIREAGGDFVLCIDCHVFLVPGAVRRLIDYFDANPQSADLIQGPMIHDDLIRIESHLDPTWRAGMFGTWGSDPAAADPDGEPFEIGMHGLGLFACRRTAWPGFNPLFRGFGGEEGYIHEKFRRAGRPRALLALPALDAPLRAAAGNPLPQYLGGSSPQLSRGLRRTRIADRGPGSAFCRASR